MTSKAFLVTAPIVGVPGRLSRQQGVNEMSSGTVNAESTTLPPIWSHAKMPLSLTQPQSSSHPPGRLLIVLAPDFRPDARPTGDGGAVAKPTGPSTSIATARATARSCPLSGHSSQRFNIRGLKSSPGF